MAGPRGHMGRGNKGPIEKAKDAKGTLKRLIKYFKEHRLAIIIILVFSMLSTVFSIIGPKVLGKATTELFTGIIAKFTLEIALNPMRFAIIAPAKNIRTITTTGVSLK